MSCYFKLPESAGQESTIIDLLKKFISLQVYEAITGVKVEGRLPLLKKETVLNSLPSEWPADPISDIQGLNLNYSKTLVVLDDDPTGTQTVHNIEVVTEWYVAFVSFVSVYSSKHIIDIL